MPETVPISHMNVDRWAVGDLVDSYTNRGLEPVEALLLDRHADDLRGRVLELGCGAGRLTQHLVARGGTVHGIDVAEPMLEHCRKIMPTAEFSRRDLRDLRGFGEGAFDVVAGPYNVLDVLDDVERRSVLGDLHHIIAPGGALWFSTHNLAWVPHLRRPTRIVARRPSRVLENLRKLPVRVANHRRLRIHEHLGDGWGIVNDDAHDYSLLHYYADPVCVRAQLEAAGFRVEDVVDPTGGDIPEGELAAEHSHVDYYARRV